MCTIRTINGQPLRSVFTFAEIEACKMLAEKPIVGNVLQNKGEKYSITNVTGSQITVYRESKDKYLYFLISSPNNPNNGSTISNESTTTTNNNNTNNNKDMDTTTNNNNSSNNTNDKVQEALKALTAAVLESQKNSEQNSMDKEELKAMVQNEVGKAMENYKPTVTVKINDLPAVEIKESLHPQFQAVLKWCVVREPAYMYGPAGTGKTTCAIQVAKALGLPFYGCGALQSKYELEGFVNAAGEYVETEFYKAFKNGGVFLFDEIDSTAAAVLVAFNSALANRYYPFPGVGRVEAHPDFVPIAAGNTAGQGGSTAYNGRYKMDQSTIDRFAMIELSYSDSIDLQAANGDKSIVESVKEIRRVIEELGLPYTVSPRAIKRYVFAINNGFDRLDAIRQAFAGGWSKDDLQNVAYQLKGSTKFINDFKELANK